LIVSDAVEADDLGHRRILVRGQLVARGSRAFGAAIASRSMA